MRAFIKLFGLTGLASLPATVWAAGAGAANGDQAFQAIYDFVLGAATGTLGRAICIVGGLIGLGLGAAKGSALPAIVGIVLAIFGALGPSIIDAVFNGALI